ncbi:MAG: hypothetical protein H7A47_00375 [Verrucomicrobiales bacterium]|nr:hypothetical protein [Verrucomicrobiales bacterium]
MRFHRTAPAEFRLELDGRERLLLARILQNYPSIPAHYHALSRNPPTAGDAVLRRAEALRQESLAEHRGTLRTAMTDLRQRLLDQNHPGRLVVDLVADEVDRLLQAVNDVRVGAWIRLGCPDPAEVEASDDPVRMDLAFRMYTAGHFEGLMLAGLLDPEPEAPPEDRRDEV